jgi:hypothetical protein
MGMLNDTIASGGPDKGYTAQLLADGGTGFGDLRPYSIAVDFIGQAIHTTLAPKYYNDTVDITIAPTSDGGSYITAFSLSLIGGAYGDDGQNYYNIVKLMQAPSWKVDPKPVHLDGSCQAVSSGSKAASE